MIHHDGDPVRYRHRVAVIGTVGRKEKEMLEFSGYLLVTLAVCGGLLWTDVLVERARHRSEQEFATRRAIGRSGQSFTVVVRENAEGTARYRLAVRGGVWAFYTKRDLLEACESLTLDLAHGDRLTHLGDFGGVFVDHPSRGLPKA